MPKEILIKAYVLLNSNKKTQFLSGNLDEIHPWVATHSRPWLERILKDDPIARSCGRRSIPILHSILEKEIEAGGRVTSHFLTRRAPTYYGMMSVVFNVTRSNSA